jgi:hypothetical protein
MTTETFEQMWDRLCVERRNKRDELLARARRGGGVRVGDFDRLGYEEVFFKDEGEHGMSVHRRIGDEPILAEYESRSAYEDDKRLAINLLTSLLMEETTWFALDPRMHS